MSWVSLGALIALTFTGVAILVCMALNAINLGIRMAHAQYNTYKGVS